MVTTSGVVQHGNRVEVRLTVNLEAGELEELRAGAEARGILERGVPLAGQPGLLGELLGLRLTGAVRELRELGRLQAQALRLERDGAIEIGRVR